VRSIPTLLVLVAVAAAGVSATGSVLRPEAKAGPSARVGSAAFFGAPAGLRLADQVPDPDTPFPEIREFFFTRVAYSGYGGGFGGGWGRRRQAWATDYPAADRHFMTVLKRLTNLDGYDYENVVQLHDDALRRFPFIYALEVGYMDLSEPEVRGLRDYLNAGGFLVIDDFWGLREYENFEYQMARVLPGRPIVDIPLEHPLFNSFYDIAEVRQTPAIGRGVNGRPTWERPDAKIPMVKGIYDDNNRLMVVINWNTDLGDAWEHAENPFYPLEYSTYAYQVGVNMVVYGMSH
jgi:hypothetical protein